jgi:hypothetical protein
MSVVEMEAWEEEAFPAEKDKPDVYLDLRNHIIHEWFKNVQRRLPVQHVCVARDVDGAVQLLLTVR